MPMACAMPSPHLRDAGEDEAADLLLLDPAWMQAKLDALGIQLLLADYV